MQGGRGRRMVSEWMSEMRVEGDDDQTLSVYLLYLLYLLLVATPPSHALSQTWYDSLESILFSR